MEIKGWTTEQATELYCEIILCALEGVEDDDGEAPKMVIEQLAEASGHDMTVEDYTISMLSTGEVRKRMREARTRLAKGELIQS